MPLGVSGEVQLGKETIDADYVSDSSDVALIVFQTQKEGLYYLSYNFNRTVTGSLNKYGLTLPFTKISVISTSSNAFTVLGITSLDRNAYLYSFEYDEDRNDVLAKLITVQK